MSQPPYPPPPGQPGPESGGGYQPPAAPGAYPPPSSGAGAYPPPSSGAGAYPPPGDGAYPPPPGGAAPQFGTPTPPKKKGSALKIVLIVFGVLALLCVGGIAVVYFAAKDEVAKVVDGAKITVVTPETLGGRAKSSDKDLQSSLDGAMADVPGASSSVGAVYGDVQKQDLVMVAAASTVSGSAQSRFDEFSKGLGSGGFNITNLSDTDPGPLGGIAKCGDGKEGGVEMALCVWSDNGSTGMIAMLFKKRADIEKEFISLRGQIEKKS
ncbi:hypothetical protein AB0M36_00985 [Actinoplanes sp. NPDC051346]|uniref:hypothetical protein n=1 Tax=Actinoplanes sp. NPDC051346 TaxID=3155048 RepID=UPI0034317728